MELRQIKTVSFGVIGTLIDSETGVVEWFRRHLRDHDRHQDDATILAAFRDAVAALERAHPDQSLTALLPRVYAQIARDWELDTDETAALDFRDSLRDWPAFPEAASCLRQLRERYDLAAVTRADRWGMAAMAQTLGDPFAHHVTADSIAPNTPEHGVWQELLQAQGCAPHEVLHCSTDAQRDIASAHAAGLATAWIEPERHDDEADAAGGVADLHVDSLRELVASLSATENE